MILLLVVAVILPTVCLLWFMAQAVENARYAVRQKLIDVYTRRATYFFVDLQESFPVEGYIKPLQVQAQSSPFGADPYVLFNLATGSVGFMSLVIYDAGGEIEYPLLKYEEPLPAGGLRAVFQYELDGVFGEAAKRYKTIAEETSDTVVRHHALLGRARCLAKLDRTPEAVEIVHDLAYPADSEVIDPALVPMIVRERVFLAELYAQAGDENLFSHLRRILADSHYNGEQENPFLPAAPAEVAIWQLDALIGLARREGLADRLAREIGLAEKRMEALDIAIRIADLYPSTASLDDWTDSTIRRIAADSQWHGLRFALADKTLLGVCGAEGMLRVLTAAVEDMVDDTVGVTVYDNFGVVVAGKAATVQPFLSLAPGKFLPEFRVDVFFRNDSVFKDAAGRETAVYVWTGTLVVVLILTSGGVAAKAVGRQMKLNRLKNDFIATVTHELKTPLSSMRVLVDTLLEGRYEDRVQAVEYLQLISKENLRLSRLIDNFLTFSRMDRNKRAFEIVRTSAAEIARAAVDAVQTKLEGANCRFSVSIPDGLPAVLADKDAMVTVLVNLLDNAYKYSRDEKRIDLKVSAEEKAVCFSVSDNGIGMSGRQMKRIFDRFYQADTSLSRRAEGAGLGLSIVKFICDAHNATVTVDSRPGEGSTFTVRLRAAG